MSEYFLADIRAEERAGQRDDQRKDGKAKVPENKISLMGDYLFASNESLGNDPYNATNGKQAVDAWKSRRDRR